jgi:hypothetical protein
MLKNHIHLIPESSSDDVNRDLLSRILFIPEQFNFDILYLYQINLNPGVMIQGEIFSPDP